MCLVCKFKTSRKHPKHPKLHPRLMHDRKRMERQLLGTFSVELSWGRWPRWVITASNNGLAIGRSGLEKPGWITKCLQWYLCFNFFSGIPAAMTMTGLRLKRHIVYNFVTDSIQYCSRCSRYSFTQVISSFWKSCHSTLGHEWHKTKWRPMAHRGCSIQPWAGKKPFDPLEKTEVFEIYGPYNFWNGPYRLNTCHAISGIPLPCTIAFWSTLYSLFTLKNLKHLLYVLCVFGHCRATSAGNTCSQLWSSRPSAS